MSSDLNVIIIGASTGGVRTLQTLLGGMPVLQAALVVVQHMPAFISDSFPQILAGGSAMQAKMAETGDALRHGFIYIAPGDQHLLIVRNRSLALDNGPKVHYVRPCIDLTMQSVRQGLHSLTGVILTGMGRDGAEGIRHIKALGGTTMAQNEASSIVYGMPRAAIETSCVDHILPPEAIRDELVRRFARQRQQQASRAEGMRG
jgi:two-component system chemotaxis response regulator CheB